MQDASATAWSGPTAEDVAFYRENGWLKIPSLLARATIESLHERWLVLGEQLRKAEGQGLYTGSISQRQHRLYDDPTKYDEAFRAAAISAPILALAKAVMGVDEVKLMRATVFEKGRASEDNLPTTLHQDFPYIPFDRSGNIQIWIALTDITASMGTLRFINRSHRELGSMGRVNADADEHAALLRRLGDYELTEPFDLRAGDATVHHDLTMHGTDRNQTEQLRTGFAMMYLRPDVRYTGATYYATDGKGLTVGDRLPDDLFPSRS